MASSAVIVPHPGSRDLQSTVRGPAPFSPAYGYEADYEVMGAPRKIDYQSLWAILVRERRLVALVIAAALCIGIVSIYLSPSVYRAEAVIQIDQAPPRVLGTEDLNPPTDRAEIERALQTQVDLIQSRSVAAAIVEDLKLDQDQEFLGGDGNLNSESTPITPTEQAIRSVRDGLSVVTPKSSRLISVYFEGRDPETAAAIANSAVQNLIETGLERRLSMANYSKDFLAKQIGGTKERLEQSERALVSYSRAVGYVDASGAAGSAGAAGGRSLTTANLVDLNAAYAQAQSNRLRSQERWQQANSTPVMSLPEVLANPTIQELTRTRAELDAAFQEQRQRHKDGHPAMQQAAAKLQELDQQIASIAASIRNSLRDQYRVAANQEQALAGTLRQLKSATLSEQEKGVRYNILQREVESNRNMFNNLLQRYNAVSSEAGLISNNVSIVDEAVPPVVPIAPNPAINMAAAGFGGLGLAFLLAMVRQRRIDAANDPHEIERDLQLPVLGLVPAVQENHDLQRAVQNPYSPFNEAHHSISVSLNSRLPTDGKTVLMVTSSRQEEGKSVSAMKLATNLAHSGRRVLLVDGDLRRGSMHSLLGMSNDQGLSDFLQTNLPFTRVVQRTETENLHFLARGRALGNAAELLSHAKLLKLIVWARAGYDAVVIDGPPVLGLADAPRLAAAADATVFLMEAHGARMAEAKLALRRLTNAGANVVGVVMTKFDPAKAGRQAGYDYTYNYGDEIDAEYEVYSEARA